MTIRYYIDKFLLLSWKLHKTQWNRRFELLWVIFAPILLLSITICIRLSVDAAHRYNSYYDPVDLDQSWTNLMDTLQYRQNVAKKYNKSHNVFMPHLTLAWGPNDYNIFGTIIEVAMKDLHRLQNRSFSNCAEVERAMLRDHLFVGICFDRGHFDRHYKFHNGKISPTEVVVPHFNYTIIFPSELRVFNGTFIGDNWKTIYHDDPKLHIVNRLSDKSIDGNIYYIREGFIKIQKAITESYLHIVAKSPIPKIVLRRFPVDGRIQDPVINYVNRAVPLLIILGYLFPAQILVWQIVDEKQRQMRVFLINMNIGNILQFVSWFIKGLLYMLISSVGVLIILKVRWYDDQSIIKQCPWYVLYAVLAAYNVSAVSFCLMIASFFKNSALAIRVATVMWLLTYIPFFILSNNREKANVLVRYLICAMPNTVLSLVFEALIEREVIVDQDWEDQAYILNNAIDRLQVSTGAWIFLAITLVYSSIGIYMDVWNTGEMGGRRRKHIPAPMHSGDFTFQEREDSFIPQGSQTVGVKATKIYEVEPSHRRFKIKIKKLCKRYAANSRGALNSFTWNVYENEVTVLMGHNGCGKTTLLKILGGLVEPTRGLVNVADFNIQTERQDASKQLGLALSDDLLFPDLSVADQIRFICMVKGMSWSKSAAEIEYYTEILQIDHIKHIKVKSLTEQERNLLIIACAFAGGSPIILIDDLHADLDLITQAHICDLINEEKSRRTIILVSNSTSLASHLADRLAIMSNGELKCTGTKPFLRNMYGHGFRLTCVKGKNFKSEELCKILNNYVPNLTLESDIGFKVTFVLENKYEDRFPNLFDELEQEMDQLDILSFRLRDTSLDEIFLRFGSEEIDLGTEQATLLEDFKLALEEADASQQVTGHQLTGMHFQALFQMRWLLNKRQLPITIINLIGLLVATVCAFSSIVLYGKNFQLIPISFNLTQLHHINVFLEIMVDNLDASEMQEIFMELLFWYDGHVRKLRPDGSNFYLLEDHEFNKGVNFRYLFGITLGQDIVTVWYNNIPLHTAPFALNLAHNVVGRRYFDEEASIDVTMKPLPFHADVNTFPQLTIHYGGILGLNLSLIFSNIWPSISFSRILNYAFKRQQYLAGVRLSTYVLASVFYDFLRVIFTSMGITILICIFLSPKHDLHLYVWIFVVLILTGFSVITLSYLFSTIFKEPNYTFIVVCVINALGTIAYSIILAHSFQDISEVFKIFSQYTFGTAVYKIFYIYHYDLLCADPEISFLSKKVFECGALPNCCMDYDYCNGTYDAVYDIFSLCILIALPLLLFILEELYTTQSSSSFFSRGIHKPCNWSRKRDHQSRQNGNGEYMVDESAIAEKQRVETLSKQERFELATVCQNLGKSFGKKCVIIRIDLCVAKADCIGILGNNNTGKSTFCKMLVGEMRPTQGELWIGGYSMEHERAKCYPLIGYCAQHQILPTDFTPKEVLLLHAKLHGLTENYATQICEGLSNLLGFHGVYHQLMRACTSGQLRRIAFALSLLGNPLLICVDGSPGGIDPNGKRTFYTLTAYMQQRGCSFVYTNLSGLDCERMCQRMPVLHKGQLWAMGSQETRYRRGYMLEVRFKRKINADVGTARSTWDRINQFPVSPHNKFLLFVQVKFPEAMLQNKQAETMSFYIPQQSSSFSEIFLIIRKDAFELNIEDFYITRNIVTGMHMDLFDRSALKLPFFEDTN